MANLKKVSLANAAAVVVGIDFSVSPEIYPQTNAWKPMFTFTTLDEHNFFPGARVNTIGFSVGTNFGGTTQTANLTNATVYSVLGPKVFTIVNDEMQYGSGYKFYPDSTIWASTTGSGGTTGGLTFTVASTSNIYVGMGINGTNVPSAATVKSISGTTITFDAGVSSAGVAIGLTGAVSGTVTFTTARAVLTNSSISSVDLVYGYPSTFS